jgi:hypothetical protein
MKENLLKWSLSVAFLFGVYIVSITPRQEFELLLIGIFFAFVAWVQFAMKPVELSWMLFLAVLGRFIFTFQLPMLSDDFYRFIWDGELLLRGANPIGSVPRDVSESFPLKETLLAKMNSAQYPSVYPPLHQVGLALGALFDSLHSQVNAMRLFIFFFEMAGLLYFWRFSSAGLMVYLAYLMNPLTIIEGVGNVHFEAALVPLLAISLHSVKRGTSVGTIAGLAGAILMKLNPLMLFPAYWNEKNGPRNLFVVGLLVALAFLPFSSGFTASLSGIDLFFRTFEFNSSLYYLVSAVGDALVGYNAISVIGPGLAILSLILIVFVGFSKNTLLDKALLAYLIFLLLASTVHPWYAIPVIYLALATDRKAIAIWSFTVLFSYSHYLGVLEPKFGWILAEYTALIAAIIYEFYLRPIQLFRGWYINKVSRR